MDILLYSSLRDSAEIRLLKVINPFRVEIIRNASQLKDRLNVPSQSQKLLILLIHHDCELHCVAQWIHLFPYLLIIVILQNENPDIFKIAHRLRPRYISMNDNTFQDVAAVLNKMQWNHCLHEISADPISHLTTKGA